MSEKHWQQIVTICKYLVGFLAAFAAFLAAYPGSEIPPLVRIFAGATAAGCAPVLLSLHPPGRPEQDARVADILEQRMKRQQADSIRITQTSGFVTQSPTSGVQTHGHGRWHVEDDVDVR